MEPITSTLAVECGKRIAAVLVTHATSAAKVAGVDYTASLAKTYQDYVLKVSERYSNVRTFLDRNDGRYIYDFYVPSSLAFNNETLAKPTCDTLLASGRLFIVTGQGGSGKSMFMRHLLIDALLSHKKIPIFIELRNIPRDKTLHSLIHDSLAEHGLQLDIEVLNSALKQGVFLILLDGFDELSPEARKSLQKDIQSTAAKSNSNFILSSRPDNTFHSWNGWIVSQIAPLTCEQACELVEKTSFHADAKRLFIKKLKETLYKSHNSFLSNPLLLSIMLLTYEHDADIPTKLSVFYSRAYDALFTQHDALKGEYHRVRKTNLDITDFAKVFSAFSFLTYLDRNFRFGLSYAVDKITTAASLTSVSVKADDYLEDARRAVCLLVEEGLDISFTHRSFQEYFAARYISKLSDDLKRDFIRQLFNSTTNDSVLDLLYEMDTDAVNTMFLVPEVEKQFKESGSRSAVTLKFYQKLIGETFSEIILPKNDTSSIFVVGKGSKNKSAILYALNKWLSPLPYEKEDWSDFGIKARKIVADNDTSPGSHTFKLGNSHYGKKIITEMGKLNWQYSKDRVAKVKTQLVKVREDAQSKDAVLKNLLNK